MQRPAASRLDAPRFGSRVLGLMPAAFAVATGLAVRPVLPAWRFRGPQGLPRYWTEGARHRRAGPAPRPSVVRARLALGAPTRARAEPEARRRLPADLATVLASGQAS